MPQEEIKLSSTEKKLLNKASKVYEKGNYKEALIIFNKIKSGNKELEPGLGYYIRFCENVLNKPLSEEDQFYEIAQRIFSVTNLLWIPAIYLVLPALKILSEESFSNSSLTDIFMIISGIIIFTAIYLIHQTFPYGFSNKKFRCKHCGHYTGYIPPNEGFAYMGSNNCYVCGRGYPMPSVMWDTNWGQSYMYERGSVTEKEFYEDYERQNPNESKSEMADLYLKRKGHK